MEIKMNNEISNAIRDVAKLISNNEEQISQLIDIFNKIVQVQFTNNLLNNVSHAAETGPIISFKDDKGEFKVVCNKIIVTLPVFNATNNNIHHYRVDMRHEIFHAFANLLNNKTIRLDIDKNRMVLNLGGKINERNMYNVQKDQHDSYASVLFNEIVTDISAYCSYYKCMESIVNGNGLEIINDTYGMGNGYRQLFPLGMCIIKAFSNYNCDYDRLSQNKFEAKFTSDNEKVYYNDLLYGVLYNPLFIKDLFIKYTSEEDWQTLENISKRILTNFKENVEKVDYNNVKEYLNVLSKYLNKKYQMENDPIIKKQLEVIISNFNTNYSKAINYYSNLQYIGRSQ